MKKRLMLIICILLISSCKVEDSETQESIVGKDCASYELPMTEDEINECTCPEGYVKFGRYQGAYCTTSSKKPCNAHSDCPPNENCISDDGEEWFCSGRFAGCYYHDPENPDEKLCMD